MTLPQRTLFRLKVCWLLFILLNLITLLLMLMGIFSENWVSLDAEEDLVSFEGGIMSFKETSLNLEEYKDKPYAEAAEDWCNGEDSDKDYYKAGCALFSGLVLTCWLFIVFEILAAAYAITNIVAFCIFIFYQKLLGFSVVSVVLSNLWHFLAFIIHSGVNNLTFTGSCDKFRDRNNPENLCAEDGPIFALVLLVVMILGGIVQCILIDFVHKLDKNQGTNAFKQIIVVPEFYSHSGKYPSYPVLPENLESDEQDYWKESNPPEQAIALNGRPTQESEQVPIDSSIQFEPNILIGDDSQDSD